MVNRCITTDPKVQIVDTQYNSITRILAYGARCETMQTESLQTEAQNNRGTCYVKPTHSGHSVLLCYVTLLYASVTIGKYNTTTTQAKGLQSTD